MTEDKKDSVEDKLVESHRRDRSLNEKLSNENPDRVEVFNRRADSKREKYSTENYYESQEGEESEKKTREE